MVEQNTPLHIQTVGNFPIVHNLSISPAFGVFTAHIQDESTTKGDTAAFRLKTGELVTLKKSMCILCDVIKWSYPSQSTSKSDGNKQLSNDKKRRNEELEKLVEKFDQSLGKSSNYKGKNKANEEAQQEQDRAKRLKTAVNEVRGKKKKKNS
ncbi:10180_t:CDS:2 [Racocetra fulgida]|uniref:10180_t:CDS:1 n=1 Tax=Racocetra fulgida TaxID=60492 RepID=A0A9N8ZGI0_9GLOM|nr:10180_t:CDS:2 [Racocetra fulgida]